MSDRNYKSVEVQRPRFYLKDIPFYRNIINFRDTKEFFDLDEYDEYFMSNEHLYEWFGEVSESLEYLKRNGVDVERIDVFDLQEYIDLAKKHQANPSSDIYKNTLGAGDMIRALIRNPNTGQRHWFVFPLYFGKLMEIGCSGNYNNTVEVVAIEGTNRFSTGYYTVEELEALNQIAEGYY